MSSPIKSYHLAISNWFKLKGRKRRWSIVACYNTLRPTDKNHHLVLYFTTQPHYYSETHTIHSGIERFQSNEPVHVAVCRDEMIYTTDDDRHVLESRVTERVCRSYNM
mgnify:CR=1 FL=1